MKKTLVLYYSLSGHTERIARLIAENSGADTEAIHTVKDYPADYDELVDLGNREVKAGTEPALRPLAKDIAAYDVIYIGTPTWWYTMAPAVKSLLASISFAGKTVKCFQTHEGWPGHTLADMEKMLSGAETGEGLAVRFNGDTLVTGEKEIAGWCK